MPVQERSVLGEAHVAQFEAHFIRSQRGLGNWLLTRAAITSPTIDTWCFHHIDTWCFQVGERRTASTSRSL